MEYIDFEDKNIERCDISETHDGSSAAFLQLDFDHQPLCGIEILLTRKELEKMLQAAIDDEENKLFGPVDIGSEEPDILSGNVGFVTEEFEYEPPTNYRDASLKEIVDIQKEELSGIEHYDLVKQNVILREKILVLHSAIDGNGGIKIPSTKENTFKWSYPRQYEAIEEPAINIVLKDDEDIPDYRFIGVENDKGESIKVGEWIKKNNDGYSYLRIKRSDIK